MCIIWLVRLYDNVLFLILFLKLCCLNKVHSRKIELLCVFFQPDYFRSQISYRKVKVKFPKIYWGWLYGCILFRNGEIRNGDK